MFTIPINNIEIIKISLNVDPNLPNKLSWRGVKRWRDETEANPEIPRFARNRLRNLSQPSRDSDDAVAILRNSIRSPRLLGEVLWRPPGSDGRAPVGRLP